MSKIRPLGFSRYNRAFEYIDELGEIRIMLTTSKSLIDCAKFILRTIPHAGYHACDLAAALWLLNQQK